MIKYFVDSKNLKKNSIIFLLFLFHFHNFNRSSLIISSKFETTVQAFFLLKLKIRKKKNLNVAKKCCIE